jgi:hypothetical protein
MGKLLMTLLSSAAIGVGVIASTTPAAAFWTLLIPVLIGVGAGGVVTGAAVTTANQPPTAAMTPAPEAYSAPVYAAPGPVSAPGCAFSQSLGERRVEDGPNLRLSGGA